MRLGLAKRLDGLRSTLGRFTKGTSAESMTEERKSSRGDCDSVKGPAEIQLALQELRELVLETAPFEITPQADSGPLSWASINCELMDPAAGQFPEPTSEKWAPADSVPEALVSLTGQPSPMCAQQA